MRGKFFAHGSFSEVGQKQKTEEKKKERLNDGDNNGQATHCNATSCGACKAAWANNHPCWDLGRHECNALGSHRLRIKILNVSALYAVTINSYL